MADKITENSILAIGIEYTDNTTGSTKTGYIKVPNPRSTVTENQIKTAMQNYLTGNIFVDENADTVNASVATAYKEKTKRTDYDIGYFD